VSRRREQLFEQVLGAMRAFLEGSHAITGALRKINRLEIFCLQAQRRDRRAQFMRGIGNETPLLIHQEPHALQQPVDRGNERMEFVGRAAQRGLGYVVGGRLASRSSANRDHPAQRSCDYQRRHQHQARIECGYRKNRAERDLARYLIPNGCALDYGELASVRSRPQ
jgi:hypothetical protein